MSNSNSIPSSLKESPTETKGTWRFVVYSAIGIFAFFVPFTVGETNSILLDHLVNWLQSLLGSATKWVVYAIIAAGAFYPFVTGRFRKSGSRLFFAVLGLFGLIVATMLMFNFGPAIVFEERIGPFLYDKLVIPVGLLVPIGAIFLAFLVSFGLMEFVGVLVQKFMRPVFRTPGRSAIDAVASFVGSYSLGLLVTDRVYKSGGYTGREAAIIAAGFSTASATFMVVIARTLDLMSLWGPYFFTTLVVTFIVTAIIIRIPPLTKIPDEVYPGATYNPEEVVTENRIKGAWKEASKTLNASPPLWKVLLENVRDGLQMTMQILPGIMSVGFIGLVVAYYTPFFKILGYIFYPFVWVLGIPEPQLAMEALSIGLSELFLPATLAAGSSSEMLRFLIAVVSVSQVFFFSSMIPAVLATDIPLKVWHMVVIWFFRVTLSLVIAFPFALIFTS